MLDKEQIFSIFLHRDNGTYSYTYRTTQLHPVGEVWPLVRKQVPSELQEVFRLAVVQPVVHRIDKVTSRYKINELLYVQKWK